jgi:hypothetical protein
LFSDPSNPEEVFDAVRLMLAGRLYDRAAQAGEAVLELANSLRRATAAAVISRELASGLPEYHPRHFCFVGAEADALLQLGFTNDAIERWHRVAGLGNIGELKSV